MNTTTDVKAISKEELQKKMQKNEPFQLINVLEPQYYSLGIIKGSKKIPLAQLEAKSSELDKSKEVVTYCSDISCHKSRQAAHILAEKGFKVSAYEGGIKEWTANKLPVEEKAAPATTDKAATTERSATEKPAAAEKTATPVTAEKAELN